MPAMSFAADFSQDVLVKILQHIPLEQRMSSCSLVQQSWRAAAAATTTNIIKRPGLSWGDAKALVNQLVSNDSIWTQHVTRISLEQRHSMKVVLPHLACTQLRKLHLSGFSLTLTANTHDSAVNNAALHCKGLIQSCPQLQSLSLTRSWVELAKGFSHKAAAASSVLTALTALTRLHLGKDVYGTTRQIKKFVRLELGRLSGLTGLQELGLVTPSRHQLKSLLSNSVPQQQQQQQPVQNAPQQQPHDWHLLRCVTKLSFRGSFKFSPDRTPGLYQLTNLRCLSLKGGRIKSVSQLSGMSHLESLVLHNMTSMEFLSDMGSDYDEALDVIVVDSQQDVAGTRSLLLLLPHLTGLTCLDVLGLARPATAAVQHWTSLKCCSCLQVLRLQHLHMCEDSWPDMFEGAEFADLRELRLVSTPDSITGNSDMRLMVHACPRLEGLQLRGGDIWYTSASALSRLQHLTSLQMSTWNAEAFEPLWRLRHLRHLRVGGDTPDLVLVHLTGLTNLTSFERRRSNLQYVDEWGKQVVQESWRALHFDQSQGKPVWQQILDHCQRSEWCAVHLQHSRGLRTQLAAQQQEMQQQTERMQRQQQRHQQQTERLQQLQHQLRRQQQQLEAQDQLMAEQAAELALLRAQQAGQQAPA